MSSCSQPKASLIPHFAHVEQDELDAISSELPCMKRCVCVSDEGSRSSRKKMEHHLHYCHPQRAPSPQKDALTAGQQSTSTKVRSRCTRSRENPDTAQEDNGSRSSQDVPEAIIYASPESNEV